MAKHRKWAWVIASSIIVGMVCGMVAYPVVGWVNAAHRVFGLLAFLFAFGGPLFVIAVGGAVGLGVGLSRVAAHGIVAIKRRFSTSPHLKASDGRAIRSPSDGSPTSP
jgi:hypothetical protein